MAVTTSLFVSTLILLHLQLVTNGTWKLSKADWTTFSSKASSDLDQNYSDDLEDTIEHFTDIVTNIAKKQTAIKKRDPVCT